MTPADERLDRIAGLAEELKLANLRPQLAATANGATANGVGRSMFAGGFGRPGTGTPTMNWVEASVALKDENPIAAF